MVNRERTQKGKKSRGLFEGTDGNNGERKKKSKVQPESQCPTVEVDIQPAKHNENHKLELQGAWEPPSRCRPLSPSEGKSSQSFVLDGNKTDG